MKKNFLLVASAIISSIGIFAICLCCITTPSNIFLTTSVNKLLVSQNIRVTDISWNETPVRVDIDKKTQINYKVLPDNATNKSVSFRVDDTSIASVDSAGVVRGLKRGTTTITITSNSNSSISKSRKIIVTDPNYIEINSITTNTTTINLEIGKSTTVVYSIEPSNATDKRVTFSSSNTNVATINQNGSITGNGAGECYITITSIANPSKTVTRKVKVQGNETSVIKPISSPSPKTETTSPKPSSTPKPTTTPKTTSKPKQTTSPKTSSTPKSTTTPKPSSTPKPTTTPKATSTPKKTGYTEKRNAIHFIQSRKGGQMLGSDTTLLESDGKFALVDTGYGENIDEVVNYLMKFSTNGKITLEFVIITHNHGDHSGGFTNLIYNDNVVIKKVYMKHYYGTDKKSNIKTYNEQKNINYIQKNRDRYNDILTALSSKNIPIHYISEKDEGSNLNLKLNNYSFKLYNTKEFFKVVNGECINSDYCYKRDLNLDSIMVEIDSKVGNVGNKTLLPGDLNKDVILNYLDKIGKVSLLEAPHHGMGRFDGNKGNTQDINDQPNKKSEKVAKKLINSKTVVVISNKKSKLDEDRKDLSNKNINAFMNSIESRVDNTKLYYVINKDSEFKPLVADLSKKIVKVSR